MATIHAERAEEHTSIPCCPVCHEMDQVQHLAAAYSRGLVRFNKPAFPLSTWLLIIIPALVYLGANGYLFVQMGGGQGFGTWPAPFQALEVLVIEASLVIALVLSLRAFCHLLATPQETIWQYPAWDETTTEWHRLYHCQREDVVFDAQDNTVLSEEQQAAFRHLNMEGMKARHGRLTDHNCESFS